MVLLHQARIQFILTKETQEKLLKVFDQLITSFEAANNEAIEIRESWLDMKGNLERLKIEFSNGKNMVDASEERRNIVRQNIINFVANSFEYWENLVLNKRPEFCGTENRA